MLAEFDIGYIYQREGLLEASARAYSSALAIDANFTSALYNLAVLETKPDPSKAASLYVRLLRIDPTAASVNFSYGLLLISTGRRTTGETYVAKALRLDPALKSRVPKGDMPSTTSKSTTTSSTTTATSVVG
jgi:tetratricopeptide (TPR) repeat protein